MMSQPIRYRFERRSRGTALFGLSIPQVGLSAVAIGMGTKLLVGAPLTTRRVCAGTALVLALAALAFVSWRGRPLFEAVPTVVRHLWRSATGGRRWFCALPMVGAIGESVKPPSCLAGLEVWAVDRPEWAGGKRTTVPIGVVRDRRSGVMTAVVCAKGDDFQLLDEADQHRRIFGWGQVLAQFAREGSPVSRICWHEWSYPAPLSDHLSWLSSEIDRESVAADAYRSLLADQAVMAARHELRVTVTVDPRRIGKRLGRGRDRRGVVDALLAALRSVCDRCRDAGLVVADPLSASDLVDAVRVGADPGAARNRPGNGLADRPGLVPSVHALPLAVDAAWDHVRIDGAYHRSFWVSRWPTVDVGPRWLEPLLLDTAGTRTVTMVMEPVPPHKSRQQIKRDAVRVQGEIQARSRHELRIPIEVQEAQADVDRREAELSAGFGEYRYLALVDVAADTLEALVELSNSYVDVAAICGLELRPLDGRHDAAWACSLPIGRAPDRDITGGMAG